MKIRVFFKYEWQNTAPEAPQDWKSTVQRQVGIALKKTQWAWEQFQWNLNQKWWLRDISKNTENGQASTQNPETKQNTSSYPMSRVDSYLDGRFELPNGVKLKLSPGYSIEGVYSVALDSDWVNYVWKAADWIKTVANFDMIQNTPQQPPQSDKNTEAFVQSWSIGNSGVNYSKPLPNKKAQPPDIQPSVISSEKAESPNDVIRRILNKNPAETLFKTSQNAKFTWYLDSAIKELINTQQLQSVERGDYNLYSSTVFSNTSDRALILRTFLKNLEKDPSKFKEFQKFYS